MNKQLIESVNAKGYVVRTIHNWNDNKFGKTNIIVIEDGEYRISFITNVLYGINYFQIHQVTNYLTNRTYTSSRFHHKFISLISEINGQTYIKLKEEK